VVFGGLRRLENMIKFGVAGYRRGVETLTAHTLERSAQFGTIKGHALQI
jgi:hypothetical protein